MYPRKNELQHTNGDFLIRREKRHRLPIQNYIGLYTSIFFQALWMKDKHIKRMVKLGHSTNKHIFLTSSKSRI